MISRDTKDHIGTLDKTHYYISRSTRKKLLVVSRDTRYLQDTGHIIMSLGILGVNEGHYGHILSLGTLETNY